MFNLPENIQNLVMDFAGTDKYWKTRFSNDVLTEITKGIKYVGYDIIGDMVMPCSNCYAYGLCDYIYPEESGNFHDSYMEVSYEQMKEVGASLVLNKLPWLPLEVHEWIGQNWQVANIRHIRKAIMMGVCGTSEEDAHATWWG